MSSEEIVSADHVIAKSLGCIHFLPTDRDLVKDRVDSTSCNGGAESVGEEYPNCQ